MTYVIDNVELHPHPGGFRLDWSSKALPGFGVLLFYADGMGGCRVDSEMMSKEFIAAVLAKFLEQCVDTQDAG